MKKQYFVDQLEGVVYVDPAFLKAAGQIDTDECNLFETLRKKYPAFKFAKKDLNKSNKRTYSNLTFERMEHFIKICVPEAERKTALDEFKKVCAESTTKDGPYGYVKSWFLKEYKNEYNKSSFAKDEKKNTNNSVADEEKGETENG